MTNLRQHIRALQRGTASAETAHEEVDAVLRGLAADELALLDRILTRWYEAGHPEGTLPELSELEAGDTGVVLDADSNTLIATQDEWRQYERLHSVLETLQRHHVQGSREIPARPPNNRTRTRKNR
ncbi:hypothetical protein BH20GEM2_BH20GEM2_12740 [soil metagenome]